jgi:hypothetical protein
MASIKPLKYEKDKQCLVKGKNGGIFGPRFFGASNILLQYQTAYE